MEKLRDRHGSSIVDRALRHLSIRLRSRPETSALAPEVEAQRAQLRQAEDRWLEARELRIAAGAELEFLDGELDRAVAQVARLALTEVAGRREDDRYRKLFQIAPSEATRPVGGRAQELYVRGVLAQLTSDATPFPSLRTHAKPIEDGLKALRDAEQRRADLYVPERVAATERAVALDQACRLYNSMHARLSLLFPENERLVESYFMSLRSNAPKDAGDPSDPSAS